MAKKYIEPKVREIKMQPEKILSNSDNVKLYFSLTYGGDAVVGIVGE